MITFKEIEMAGFKSFADETHINFDGGITAIVGPNGCGKSNVSDAIRWVLGEQSSKALRGKSMQDVIFAGTEKRKKLSYCEVSLVFDNTNKWFNVDYDEVVITRKLYRSGESDYMINRNPCRLKDIRDILYDSGIGKDGYSIIGQGRVEEIIQSKPEDRRAIFEEAAGIAKYKARKIETENRLDRVRENLSRANDIMTEVERRLGPLKRQSEDAKKYLEYRESLKQLEINAYLYQYEHAAHTKEEINTKLTGYKDNLAILENTLQTEQSKYDKSLNEINNLDKQSSELHDQVLRYNVELEKRQGDSRLINEQTKHLKEQLDRLTTEQNLLTTNISQKQANLTNLTNSRVAEQQTLNELHTRSQEITAKYMSTIDEITKSEGIKEQNQRAIIDNLSKLTDIKANLSAYIAKRDTLTDNITQDKSKLTALENEKQNLQNENKALVINTNKLKEDLSSSEKIVDSLNAKLNNLNAQQEELSTRIFSLRNSISNDTNRRTILSNLQADFEGYQFAVKRLLQDGKRNPKLNQVILGVVGNIINVDEKFQTAIEIALGGSVQNIVTKNENDAKVLIDYLKEMRLGRATFLPISAVKPRSISPSDNRFLSLPGCFGVASQLVKTEPMFRPVIESLLGATAVCDTLDTAVQIAKSSGYAFRIVTLEGDVLSPQGSMSGGSKKSNDSSLLSKDAEIKNLTKNIEERTKELNIANGEYSSIVEEINKVKSLLSEQNSKKQSISNDFYTSNTKLDGVNASIKNIEEEIFTIQSQLVIAQNIVDDLNSKINSIDQVELNYDASVKTQNDSDSSSYEKLKQQREEYQEIITSLRVQIASTEEKIKTLDRDIEQIKQEIESNKANLNNVTNDLSSQQKLYDELINLTRAKSNDSELNKINEELNNLNIKLSQFDDFKQALMKELKELDDKKSVITNDIAKLNNKIYQEETRMQKVDIDIENMQERIYEEYELTYNDCLSLRVEEENYDIKESLAKISRIKGLITGLGYVNVNAIEEYKTEGARYEEMNSQVEDLKKAEEDAVKIIKDLSQEMLEKFNTEFAKIQENFTKVFKELFGGGNARLELLPSEDPLTAGVEIIAQPPGKVLQQISLLSGGEKTMTAIAILFAILKLKPMPFCFLDEIEAALDDANIERYARYLKRFSDETQFIVITHRKPTMELADSLYGVTMEEKGVSKIVSVKLSDAVKTVDEQA